MKLYELADAYRSLDNLDLDDEVVKDTLEAIEGSIEAKAESIVRVIKGMEANANAIDAEIVRLEKRKQAVNNRASGLRDYLRINMMKIGLKKIRGGLVDVCVMPGVESVSVDDESSIPDEFMRIKSVPNKVEIKAAIKRGEVVAGASLKIGETSLQIR